MRHIEIFRQTLETKVFIAFKVPSGIYINTGIPFFDHMLHQVSCHSGLEFSVCAVGDLHSDKHHLVEDVGILLGHTIRKVTGCFSLSIRYGNSLIVLDESLTSSFLDLSGRANMVLKDSLKGKSICVFNVFMVLEFLSSISRSALISVHLRVVYGFDIHHRIETMCKSLGRSVLRVSSIGQRHAVSTKGGLSE